MRVQLATKSDLNAWQEFVDRTPAAGHMHHAGWYGVLEDAYWVKPYFMMALNESNEVKGVLPVYLACSPFVGRYLSSLEDGILAGDSDAANALLTEAGRLRNESGARYLQIRGGNVDTPSPHIVTTVRTVIDTTKSEDELWNAMKQSGRRAVRKGERQNLAIEIDAPLRYLDEFYRIYARHMHELGTPVIGMDAFLAAKKYLGAERIRLYLVRHQQKLIGGMLCVLNSNRWTSVYAAVQVSHQTEFANYQLYWRVIRDACALKIRAVDLGRSTPGSTVHVFKQRWGGTDAFSPYFFFPAPGRNMANPGLETLKRGRALPQRIWSSLPLAVCNRLGPLLRKQLPFI